MAKVVQRKYEDGSYESFDSLLRRFKKKCLNEGLMDDIRKKDYYISPSLRKKLKHEATERRLHREEAKRQAAYLKRGKKMKRGEL